MPLTPDQKKHLLIGGGVGALAAVVGSAIFGGRKDHAHAAALHLPREAHGEHHRRHASQDPDGQGENERGEYGSRKHRHHHHHERERGHGE